MRTGDDNMFDEESMMGLEEDDEELDIYAALGLNAPVEPNTPTNTSQSGFHIDPTDPLAAFMDDDEDETEEPLMFGQMSSPSVPVEELLAVLVKDTLNDGAIQDTLPSDSIRVDLDSTLVQKDRDAYHLSLIIDMGGEQIKPFATVRASGDTWAPMQPPKGLHQGWLPLYHSLAKALTNALMQQGRPSSL